MNGRRQPYTVRGIRRVSCAGCGLPSRQQWQICADDNLYRGVCNKCDIALNRLVLEFFHFEDVDVKLAAYAERLAS